MGIASISGSKLHFPVERKQFLHKTACSLDQLGHDFWKETSHLVPLRLKRRQTSLQPISPKPGSSGQICTSYFGVNCPFLNRVLIASAKKLPVTHSGFKKDACWLHTTMTTTPPWGHDTCVLNLYVHTERLIIMCHCNGQLLVAQCSTHFNLSFPHRARSQTSPEQTGHEASAVPLLELCCLEVSSIPRGLFSSGSSHTHILRHVSSDIYFPDETVFHYPTPGLYENKIKSLFFFFFQLSGPGLRYQHVNLQRTFPCSSVWSCCCAVVMLFTVCM